MAYPNWPASGSAFSSQVLGLSLPFPREQRGRNVREAGLGLEESRPRVVDGSWVWYCGGINKHVGPRLVICRYRSS